MICKKNMRPCLTPGRCAPFQGCGPGSSNEPLPAWTGPVVAPPAPASLVPPETAALADELLSAVPADIHERNWVKDAIKVLRVVTAIAPVEPYDKEENRG